MCGRSRFAIAVSSALAGCSGGSENGACAPSTIMSASEIWMTSSISRMPMAACSRIARDTPVAAERLKYPWRSIGVTHAIATFTVRNCR